MIFRQAISVFLSFYILAMAWIPVFVFKHQQYIVRKEMKWHIKNGVPEEERLTFFACELEKDSENLTWIHSKEFRYKGEMYDILEEVLIDGKKAYICIHDVKESGLFAKLDDMVEKAMQSNTPLNSHRKAVGQFYASLYYQQAFECNFYKNAVQKLTFFWQHKTKTMNPKPETHPPEYDYWI